MSILPVNENNDSLEVAWKEKEHEMMRVLVRRLLRPSNKSSKEEATLCPGKDNALLVEEAGARCFEAMDNGSVCINLDNEEWLEYQVADVVHALEDSPACAVVGKDGYDRADARNVPFHLEPAEGGSRWLYLTKFYRAEKQVAEQLYLRQSKKDYSIATDKIIQTIKDCSLLEVGLEEHRGRLSPMQARALTAIARNKFVVLTGGPGTGKTATVAHMIEFLRNAVDKDIVVRLTAPTGKAANRLKESIQHEAQEYDSDFYKNIQATTLHKLLGARLGIIESFTHGPSNLVFGDIFIIDEASMIPLLMFKRFLESIPKDARVIILGDPEQLASVEAGTVLADIVRGMQYISDRAIDKSQITANSITLDEKLKALWESTQTFQDGTEVWCDDYREKSFSRLCNGLVELTRGHRSKGEVGNLVQLIKEQKNDEVLACLRNVDAQSTDERTLERIDSLYDGGQQGLRESLINHYALLENEVLELRIKEEGYEKKLTEAEENYFDYEYAKLLTRMNDLRLLCAKRHGFHFGSNSIFEWNATITSELGEKNGSVELDAFGERLGAIIVVRKNQQELNIQNGDTGLLVKRGLGEEAVFRVALPTGDNEHPVRYVSRMEIDAAELGYAITIHTSQGSEYKHAIVMLTNEADSPLNLRELIYTGISRAQERVSVVGTEEVLKQGLASRVDRASRLAERLYKLYLDDMGHTEST